MSYLALARKWRPRTFSQLVGQEHINKALINALNQQRLHHAYLFTGTRGVGKTSVARILAKALNCEIGISATPCLQCDACLAIEQGRFIDLIEIDGASKTRVEDTRELLDNVQYAPASGRFKIYLIDEVHMLSQHSFNALLKTLEEPPLHVKFILATTDPQKLPVTILSRCLQFNLKHLSVELISQQLELILKDEHLDYETLALNILAQAAHGSMRDALSLLDQAITSCDVKLLANDVKMILGYTQQDYAIKLIQALAEQNATNLLQLSQQIANEGGHFQYVLDELLNYFHLINIYQNIGDQNALISPSMEVKSLANQFSKEDIQLFYQIALKGCEEIHLAPTLAIGFNMTMLRMLTFKPAPPANTPPLAFQQNSSTAPSTTDKAPPQNATKNTERAVSENTLNRTNEQDDTVNKESAEPISPVMGNLLPVPSITTKAETKHAAPQTEQNTPLVHEDLNTAPVPQSPSAEGTFLQPNKIDDWNSIVSQLKLAGLALNAIENAEFVAKNGRDIILKVAKGHQSLFSPTILSRIEAALANYYQTPVKITLQSNDAVHATPAQHKEKLTQEKQQGAEQALQNDPLLQQIKKEFSAELVKNSIVPLKDDL
ncbi:DNA polymerase III subunit gamma/tau [Legionella fallonii]|uniref:DNA polymerase III subunit gamma/tau n=1 Tax=Legionella fallonii LLAP-10 TaxID=1212491 RepID=A0A098G8D9_9GAMM|nr:DNA polymerase III subunit gamma/tau [Legionella fallonii]CEG58748.1 DNA polymerase III/DNA elongation factor III, tau and gamma subunits [Legionella fallonii LLAP-10]